MRRAPGSLASQLVLVAMGRAATASIVFHLRKMPCVDGAALAVHAGSLQASVTLSDRMCPMVIVIGTGGPVIVPNR